VLRLPTIRAQCTGAADAAEREQMTYRGHRAEMLMAECEDRDRRRFLLYLADNIDPERQAWLPTKPRYLTSRRSGVSPPLAGSLHSATSA
jgi:hypothetical protein